MKQLIGSIITIITILIGETLGAESHLLDIENHWAKEQITRMIVNEIVQGYPDRTFRPDDAISTLEFLKIILTGLNIPLSEEGLHHWPEDYLLTAKQYHIECDETQLLTRYEAVNIITRLMNMQSVSSSGKKLKDVDTTHQTNVSRIQKLKIMEGYPDGTFRGNNHLTRAEAIVIVQRTIEANQELANRKKVSLTDKVTNVRKTSPSENKKKQASYEIKQNTIYFYDTGRYANIEKETFEERNVSQQTLLQLLKRLVSENAYVALYYVPSPYMINQIVLRYGENKQAVNQNLEYFAFTYFENEYYDLKQISFQEEFSSRCYLKIQLKKMWKEKYEYENNHFVDENLQRKLLDALTIEFGEDAKAIQTIMLEKYEQKMLFNEQIVEKVVVGNYIVNIYQTDATGLEFYFEKLL